MSLSAMPVVGVGTVLYGRYIKRLSNSSQEALGAAVGVASERLMSIRTVKLFNGERREIAAFDRSVESIYAIAHRAAVASGTQMARPAPAPLCCA